MSSLSTNARSDNAPLPPHILLAHAIILVIGLLKECFNRRNTFPDTFAHNAERGIRETVSAWV